MDTSTDQLSAAELRQQLDDQRAGIGQDLVAIGDRVSPKRVTERRAAAVKEKFSGLGQKVMGAKDTVADQASSMGGQIGSAGESVGQKAGDAADQVRRAPELARTQTQGNPLAAGLIAFGGGLLAATLLPTSRREQQLVDERIQPQLEDAAGHVGEMAQEAVESVKPAAQDAVTELKDEAQQAVAEVKEQASSAAGDVADDAKQRAGELRS